MSRTYFDVKKEYDQWQGNKDKIGLSEYAQTMDRMTGKQDRAAAYNDGIATKVNAYIDAAFSPISEPLRPVGEAAGRFVNNYIGDENLPEQMGDLAVSMPRMAAEFTPWFGAIGKGTKLLKAARAATAGSAFVKGTAETGTPLGGVVQAATLPAMPAAGRMADRFVGKRIAKGLAKDAGAAGNKRLAAELTGPNAVDALSGIGQGAVRRYAASQAGIGAAGTVSDVASQTVATGSLGEGLSLLGDENYWALQTVGQVPFLGLDAVRLNAEIEGGRKITREAAKRREKLMDSMIVPEEDPRNAQLDELAKKVVETKDFDARREYKELAPSQETPDGRIYLSPKEWLRTDQYRYKTPEETISLIRTYNNALMALKKQDVLTQGEIVGAKDEIFGDGPITAEKLQKVFDGELQKGADASEATMHIVAMVKNRLGRKVVDNASPLMAKQRGELPAYEALTEQHPPAGTLRSDNKAYALQQFENAGLHGVALKNYLDIFDRTTQLFGADQDNMRLGVIRNAVRDVNGQLFKTLGLYIPENVEYQRGVKLQERMIGVLDKKFSDDAVLDQVAKITTINHELLHAWQERTAKAHKEGTLSPYEEIKYQQYQRSLEHFNALDEKARLSILQKVNDTVLPEKHLKRDGERDAEFASLEEQAARSAEETVTMIGQMMALSVLSPGKRFNDIRNDLKWLDDEVTEFANLQFRNIKQFMDPLISWFDSKSKTAPELGKEVIKSQSVTGSKENVVKSNKYLSVLLAGQRNADKIIDVFSGSGVLARFSRAAGFEGDIIENRFYATDRDIVEMLTMAESFPKELDVKINTFLKEAPKDIVKFKDYIRAKYDLDPAFYDFILRRLTAHNHAVRIDNFSPEKSKWVNRDKIVLNSIQRLKESTKQKEQQTTLDYRSVLAQAGKGDLLLYDPPYVNTRSTAYKTKDTSFIGDLLDAYRIKQFDFIAHEKFNSELVKAAKDVGLNVIRLDDSKGQVKNEIIITNLTPEQIKLSDQIRNNEITSAVKQKEALLVTIKALDGIIGSHEEIIKSQQQLGQLAANLRPSEGLIEIDGRNVDLKTAKALGGFEKATATIKKAMGLYSDEELFIKRGFQLGNIERLLGNPSQMSTLLRKHGLNAPADVIDYVQDIPAQIEKFRTTMVRPFLTVSKSGKLVSLAGTKHPSKLNTEETKHYNALQVILSNENAYASFSDIALLHGELERALSHDDPGFKEAVKDGRIRGYEQLDDDAKTNVWHVIETIRQQNKEAAILLKRGQYEKLAMFATKAFRVDNPDVSTKAAHRLMQRVFAEAAISRELANMPPEQMAQAALSTLRQQSPDLKLDRIEQLAARLLPKYFQVMEVLDAKQEYFFTERRIGDHLFTYKRRYRNDEGEIDTETVTVSARTRADLKKLQDKIMSEDNVVPGTERAIPKSELVDGKLPASRDKFLETIQPFENALYEAALKHLGPEEANRMRELYQPIERTLEKAKKETMNQFLKPRNLRAGREYIDMFDAAIDYYNALAYKLANDQAKGYTDMMLQDKQMEAHPQLKDDIMTWADNLTKRKGKEFSKIKNAIFTYFLGFNPSSMMIELAQPVITTTPIIIEEIGGHVGKAHTMLGEAYKTLGRAYSGARGETGRLKFNDPVLEENFNRAITERIMEYGSIEELSTPDELMNLNAWRLQQGLEGMSPKELLTQPLHYFSKYGRGLYSTVSGLNAKISYIIGHDIARQRGMSKDDAHNFAKGFIRRTTHSGGEYNRPMGFSKLGKAQSSVSVAYTLNNFTFATLHMMSRLFKDAIGRQGLSKADQAVARKALGTMLTGQFVLAGALGMPFAGAAVTILEELFGTTIRDDIRTSLAELSGDTEMGAMFADVATRGFPTLMGVDAQSRFGLGSVLGFSEYQGFDATGFLGAAGGVVEHMYKGLSYSAKGEFGNAAESFLPQALKRPVEMMNSKGKYLDAKGELLVDPTTAEQFAYLIGFRPKRFSDVRLMQRVNRTSDDLANKERRKKLQIVAENFQDKSGKQIRAELQQLMQNDPMFQFDDMDDLTNRLVDLVMEKQVPIDPMRTGSYASLPDRERFAATLPEVRKGAITEQQRLALEAMIKGTITGRPEAPSKRQLTRAQMLDEFLRRNPTMSPQRAKLELEQRL